MRDVLPDHWREMVLSNRVLLYPEAGGVACPGQQETLLLRRTLTAARGWRKCEATTKPEMIARRLTHGLGYTSRSKSYPQPIGSGSAGRA